MHVTIENKAIESREDKLKERAEDDEQERRDLRDGDGWPTSLAAAHLPAYIPGPGKCWNLRPG